MIKSAASKVMWVGRATVFLVGLAVILALWLVLWAGPAKADHVCTLAPALSYSTNEGGSVALSASSTGCETINWDFNNDGQYNDATGENVTFAAGQRDGPGSQAVGVKGVTTQDVCAYDPDAGRVICLPEDDVDTAQTTVNIVNVPPTATFNAPTLVSEGDSFSLSLTNPSDPSLADTSAGLAYAFDCGLGFGYRPFSSSSTANCVILDKDGPGSLTVRAKIRDKDGGEREYTRTVTLNNIAPTATFNAPQTSYAGKSLVVSLTGASDPSKPDRDAGFTYAFDCGSGSGYGAFGSSSVVSCQGGPAGTSKTVRAKIKDKDEGVREYTRTVTVNAAPPSYPNGKIAFQSIRDGTHENAEIYVMNADGSGQTRLTNNGVHDMAPAYSPDGSKIAFQSGLDIYSMNANGTGVTNLTNGMVFDPSAPAYSPDSSKIAFQSGRDLRAEIYVMNADGSGVTRLTNQFNEEPTEAPAFSPNGSQIVFEKNRDGSEDIYVMNIDGSGQTRLTNNAASDTAPVFSPDGSKIVFESNRSGFPEIYAMNADGTGETNLTSAWGAHGPTFSPDGSKIAFGKNGDIWAMSPDGSNETRTTTSGWERNPSWGGAGDASPPETTLDNSGPSGPVNSTAAEFRFSSELDAVFQCRLTKQGNTPGGFEGCASPKAYDSLTEGEYLFEVQAVDKAGNVDPTPASRRWIVDTVAAKGAVTINGGAAYTKSATVKLSLSATDPSPGSGVASMRLMNDGSSWSGWMSYATTKSWTLKKANGLRTVSVQYRDKAGNVSTSALDMVKLDMVKPTISGMSPKPKSITRDATPLIKATVKDNMTNLKKANIKLYVNGKLIAANKYSYSAATDQQLLYNSPKLSKGKKTVKIVATDAARNVSMKSWYFTIK